MYIAGHESIHIGFDERARIELLVTQPLIEFVPFVFHLLARGVVRACNAIEQVNDKRDVPGSKTFNTSTREI